MNETLKEHLISGLITFVSTFLTSIGAAIIAAPHEAWTTKDTAVAMLISITLTATRAAVKGVAQATGIQKK